MAKFEVVSRFADSGIQVPVASTKNSAGYDFVVAEDIIVPAYEDLCAMMTYSSQASILDILNACESNAGIESLTYTLDELAKLTKATKCKPTLVSTGLKCKMEDNEYLQIVARSSTPLKYWLIVANAPGIIDADYYNNSDNEGNIIIALENIGDADFLIEKGSRFAQGVFMNYLVTDSDNTNAKRSGGIGSTLL